MQKWLDDVPDPVEQERAGLVAPFHDSLVPGVRLLNERSFSTRLGNLHERVAELMATDVHAEVRRALDLSGTIPVLSREFITQRISQLERRQAAPDAGYEREQIRAHFGNEVQAATRIDLLPFFDFTNEVMLGAEFWDFVGGDGAHDELLAIYEDVGEEFASEIDALRGR